MQSTLSPARAADVRHQLHARAGRQQHAPDDPDTRLCPGAAAERVFSLLLRKTLEVAGSRAPPRPGMSVTEHSRSRLSAARAPVMLVTSYTPAPVVDSTRQMTSTRASALAQPLNTSSLSSTLKNSGSCRTTCTITPKHERNRTLPLSPPCCTRASDACHQIHARVGRLQHAPDDPDTRLCPGEGSQRGTLEAAETRPLLRPGMSATVHARTLFPATRVLMTLVISFMTSCAPGY